MKLRSASELDRRLDDHFSSLPSLSAVRSRVKQAVSNWQAYAAALSSAAAMMTSASASVIGAPVANDAAEPGVGAVSNKRQFASSRSMPILKAVRRSMANLNAQKLSPRDNPPPAAPAIASNGIVPVGSTSNTIQPGEWVAIYGSNLSAQTAAWNGDFPLSLGDTSVTINGKSAYLMYVSPSQINLQAPDDTATGQVAVVVTTPAGSATSYVTLSTFAPSFGLAEASGTNREYVAGIIVREDGSGAYGGGAYDVLGPGGDLLGYSTTPARPGDTVELFGFGFGPVSPLVPAGQAFTGAAPLTSNFALRINNVSVTPDFVGMSAAGLYQVNIVVPEGIGEGDLPIRALVGGAETQPDVVFPVVSSGTPVFTGTGGVAGAPGTYFFGSTTWGFGPGTGTQTNGFGGTGGPGGGSSGGGGTGGGGGGSAGGSAVIKPQMHIPKLRFPAKTESQ